MYRTLDPESWECSVCTYRNLDPNGTHCEVCGSPRPPDYVEPPPAEPVLDTQPPTLEQVMGEDPSFSLQETGWIPSTEGQHSEQDTVTVHQTRYLTDEQNKIILEILRSFDG